MHNWKQRILAAILSFSMMIGLLLSAIPANAAETMVNVALSGSASTEDGDADGATITNPELLTIEEGVTILVDGVSSCTHASYVNGFCTVCAGYEPCQGSGLATDPYTIANAGQLYWFAQVVNSGDTDANAIVTADIVVNKNVLNEDGTLNGDPSRYWTPIGNATTAYTGTFDGNDHTIGGLYFNNRIIDPPIGENSGLFGYTGSSAVIQNITVADSYLVGRTYVGGVVGRNYGTLTNCHNTAVVGASSSCLGGIVGENQGSLTGCSNSGTVGPGSSYIGGVAGRNKGTVTQCHNTGKVIGTSSTDAGGVVGGNSGTLTLSYNTGYVYGFECYVGGVSGSNSGTVENCYNIGTVVCGYEYVAGVVGYNTGRLADSYNTGNVTWAGSTFIGAVTNNGTNGTAANCYYLTGCAVDGGGNVHNGTGTNSGIAAPDTAGCTEAKTLSQFISGEVAYLLNGSASEGDLVWFQTIGTDTSPRFEGKTVYFDENVTPPYFNEAGPHTHSYNQTVAEDCYLASEATCLAAATYYYCCSCGEMGTETFPYGGVSDHAYDVDGKCGICDVQAVAKVGETCYLTIEEAHANWTAGTTMTMLADAVYRKGTMSLTASGLVLDLNGHMLTTASPADDDVFNIYRGAELTVRDSGENGTLESRCPLFLLPGSKVTLESGTVSGKVHCNGSEFYMTGGAVTASIYIDRQDSYYPTVVVTGGTISGSPAILHQAGSLTIGGNAEIISETYVAVSAYERTNTIISGTPVIRGGLCDFVLLSPITLNTQPVDDTWSIRFADPYTVDYIFAVPGDELEGELDPTKFVSAMLEEGYGVFRNSAGQLGLCKHSADETVEQNCMGYRCENCGTWYGEAGNHAYGQHVFNWGEGNATATVTFTCNHNESHIMELEATVTFTATEGSCETAPVTTYTATATYEGETYTDTKTVTGEPLNHDYGTPEIVWNADYSAYATVTCSHDNTHVERLTASVKGESVEGDCQTREATVYTATVVYDEETYTFTNRVEGEFGEHSWLSATCTVPETCEICGETEGDPLNHAAGDTDNDHLCDACGDELSQCADADNDHNCDICGDELSQCADADNDHNCDVCGDELSQCADADNDHNCDVCGDELSQCDDDDNDHNCDVCGDELSQCADADNDHNCDVCGDKLSECADANNDHLCDVCGDELSQCADDDNDHNCDVCGDELSQCADADKDHLCDTCGDKLSDCADADNDHLCDVCGDELSQCADADNDHNCDVCGDELSQCADADNDHNCDVCGDELSQCADADNDHNCDICGDELSQCADADNDHLCDTCGDKLSECADPNKDHNCDVCGDKLSDCVDADKDGRCDICNALVPLPAPAKPYKIVNVVSGVHVYWKATEGAAKYGLWRSETGKNGTYKWVANPTVPHFTDTKVESGKTYYYKVTAMNANGQHSEKSEAIGVTYVATPDITSRFNKAAGITLGWNRIEGATGYAIYRKSYSGNDAWVRVGTVSGNATFTWQDTSVKNNNGSAYKYTIRALAGADMKTLSGCRNAGRSMVRLTSRTLSSAVKASATSIKCTWTTSAVVTGYEVRFMVGSTVYKTFTIGNYKTGVKTFTGLESGKTYKIQVRSYVKIDGMGFYSAWSTARNVTLP